MWFTYKGLYGNYKKKPANFLALLGGNDFVLFFNKFTSIPVFSFFVIPFKMSH